MQFLPNYSKWESGSENGHTKSGMEPENARREIVTVELLSQLCHREGRVCMKLNGIWLTHVKLASGQELVLRKNDFYGWLGGWVCVFVGGTYGCRQVDESANCTRHS